ncbi:NUDIX hydrolase [Serratia sp. NPDC078593]|uniref:NUDIX hydrolase n=1 Tax=unclassified Serratia (in: enterobacteria) TaxID=2647522 RepID=UPI0037D6235F
MAEQCFGGAKIALLHQEAILVYLRDNRADIPWPGQWDLPGGGREGHETPLACIQRETREEFGLTVLPQHILWQRRYDGVLVGQPATWFMVGTLAPQQIAAIQFGEEGQYWRMMAIDVFIHHPHAISHLRQRLADYMIMR